MRADELNNKAAELLGAQKLDELRELAKKHGIPEMDVEDYIDGDQPVLTTNKILAIAKINQEAEAQKLDGIMEDWVSYIKVCISEDLAMAVAVCEEKKTIEGCCAALVKWSLENAKPVKKEICEAAGVPKNVANNVKLGIPSMRKAKELIREYYLGGEKC